MNRSIANLVTCAGLALGISAGAAQADAPKPDCAKPPELGVQPSYKDQEAFRTRLDAYRDCMNAFIDQHSKLAREHNDAAQAAVAEYNAYVTDINKRYSDK